jgi:hypothetical protein
LLSERGSEVFYQVIDFNSGSRFSHRDPYL